eukprot:gene27284-biopygen8093
MGWGAAASGIPTNTITPSTSFRDQFLMNSCHGEGVCDGNRWNRNCFAIPVANPPRDMSSSETGQCYSGIDECPISPPIILD